MDKERMNSIVKTLKSDLVQVMGPNEEEVSALVLRAKGDVRTLKEFADATGISAPTLSRILNGKIARPLSPEAIVSIINASQYNTLNAMYELARANGYISKAEQAALQARYKLRNSRNGMHMSVKSIMHTTIVAELHQRCEDMDGTLLTAEPGELFTVIDQAVKYDFSFEVTSNKETYTWAFFTFPQRVEDFKLNGISADRLARNVIRDLSPVFLTDAWLPAQYTQHKISFCFVDKEMFESFTHLVERGKLHNRFSTVLIDEVNAKFLKENEFKKTDTDESIFERPLKVGINFVDDSVADEDKEYNFSFIQEGGEHQ